MLMGSMYMVKVPTTPDQGIPSHRPLTQKGGAHTELSHPNHTAGFPPSKVITKFFLQWCQGTQAVLCLRKGIISRLTLHPVIQHLLYCFVTASASRNTFPYHLQILGTHLIQCINTPLELSDKVWHPIWLNTENFGLPEKSDVVDLNSVL